MKGMLPYTRAEEEKKRLAREEEARKRPSWPLSCFRELYLRAGIESRRSGETGSGFRGAESGRSAE